MLEHFKCIILVKKLFYDVQFLLGYSKIYDNL